MTRAQTTKRVVENGLHEHISCYNEHMVALPPLQSPTLRAHERQCFWQILLPMLVVIVLILIASGFNVAAGMESTRLWADIAIIWIITPLLFFALLCLAVLVALIYAIYHLTKATPRLTTRVQHLAVRISAGTQHGANAAVRPVVWLKQVQAVLRSLFKK